MDCSVFVKTFRENYYNERRSIIEMIFQYFGICRLAWLMPSHAAATPMDFFDKEKDSRCKAAALRWCARRHGGRKADDSVVVCQGGSGVVIAHASEAVEDAISRFEKATGSTATQIFAVGREYPVATTTAHVQDSDVQVVTSSRETFLSHESCEGTLVKMLEAQGFSDIDHGGVTTRDMVVRIEDHSVEVVFASSWEEAKHRAAMLVDPDGMDVAEEEEEGEEELHELPPRRDRTLQIVFVLTQTSMPSDSELAKLETRLNSVRASVSEDAGGVALRVFTESELITHVIPLLPSTAELLTQSERSVNIARYCNSKGGMKPEDVYPRMSSHGPEARFMWLEIGDIIRITRPTDQNGNKGVTYRVVV